MYNKNDQVQLNIIDLTDDGLGISKKDGRVFFVKDALPFDVIVAVITKITKNIIYAKSIKLISPSKYRIEVKCDIADKCGGCQLLKLEYNYQLEIKKKLVENKLLKIGGIDIKNIYDEMIGITSPFYFRNKMQVPFFIDKNSNISYGFYASRTHYIIPFKKCFVGFKNSEKILNVIRDVLTSFKISIYNENEKKGIFREVFLRIGNNSNEISIVYIINDIFYERNINLYKKFDEKVREKLKFINDNDNYIISTTALNINTNTNNVLLGNINYILYGKGYIIDSIGELKYNISIESFYQVNIENTQKLYDKIVEYGKFSKNEKVLDLYSGIGTISLYIARYVLQVTGVEIVSRAVDDANNNAKINNINNANFFNFDLEKKDFIDELLNNHFDVVIVDPPRKGLDINTINLIFNIKPKKLIYVSCDPGTLARDLKMICVNYNFIKISNVDMFPYTMHVESVCLLELK